MTHTVFRIENAKGLGPYKGDAQGYHWDPFQWHTQQSSQHPSPSTDFISRRCLDSSGVLKAEFKCAFRDLQSLTEWFHDIPVALDLHRSGFRVVRLEFEGELYHGLRQCVYNVTRLNYRTVIPFREVYGSEFPLTDEILEVTTDQEFNGSWKGVYYENQNLYCCDPA